MHEPWFFYLHSFFSKHGLCNPVLPKKTPSTDKKTGVTTYSYKFNTYSSLLFVAMHSLFYHSIDGKFKKRLHKELIHFLTPLSIAAWVCDDGYDNNGSTAFCTDSFSDECLDILIEIFKKKWDIRLHKFIHVKKYVRLRVDRQDMPKFVLLVKPKLHDSMLYKLGDFQ